MRILGLQITSIAVLALAGAGALWAHDQRSGLGEYTAGSYWTYRTAGGDTLTYTVVGEVRRDGRLMLKVESNANDFLEADDPCYGMNGELWDATTGSVPFRD